MEANISVVRSGDPLNRRLFSTPGVKEDGERESDEGDDPLPPRSRKKSEKRRRQKKAGFRLSVLAVLLFLVLCAIALAITLRRHQISWEQITWDRAQEGKLSLSHLLY